VPSAFRFRLEPVRALSERRETEAQSALAAAMADENAARDQVEAARGLTDSAIRGMAERFAAGAPLTGDQLRAQEAWIARTAGEHEATMLEHDRRRTETDARRGLLSDAAREREVLERLRVRRRAEHMAVMARQEQESLDEIALGMHRRRSA
jgi:flagellar FliJ protein